MRCPRGKERNRRRRPVRPPHWTEEEVVAEQAEESHD